MPHNTWFAAWNILTATTKTSSIVYTNTCEQFLKYHDQEPLTIFSVHCMKDSMQQTLPLEMNRHAHYAIVPQENAAFSCEKFLSL